MRFAASFLLAIFFACLGRLSPACAEPRVALIITNQAYTQDGMRLANTHRDGEVLKTALEKVGFQVWHVRDTASEGALLQAVGEHVARLAKAGPEAVGFLYYSGHGAADRPGGADFLIPTAAPITHVAQLPLMGVRLERITAALGGAGRMNFVVFDACRNVPLLRDTKSVGFKGLARIPEQRGLLVAYAAEPGNVAIDQNLYSTALAEEIVKPGLEAGQVFRAVARRVLSATQNRQTPEYLDKRLYDFHFAAAVKPEVRPTPAPTRPTAPVRPKTQVGTSQFMDDPLHEAPSKPQGKIPPESDPSTQSTLMMDWDALVTPPPRIADRSRKSGDVFRDCPTCPEMVVVPAGSFTMGSPASEPGSTTDERPQRLVTIARPFAVGKFEVTFAEWDACLSGGGCSHRPGDAGWGRGKRPVINVSWNDAKAYVAWLSRQTGRAYRLLSEAEWEYAARAGTTTPFSTGRTITSDQANFNGNRIGQYRQQTVPVGLFSANGFGLHDMHGNVAEWVEDCWHENYVGAPVDGSARTSGDCSSHILRGGHWGMTPAGVRSADRGQYNVVYRDDRVRGFRIGRTLDP